MDPTFGGQELFESLSQASSTGKRSKGGGSKGGGGSSSNSSLTSTHTNPIEDAYRRIGQGLSQRAQGVGDDHPPPQRQPLQQARARLGTHPRASFHKYQRPAKKPFNPHEHVGGGGGLGLSLSSHSNLAQGGPTPKVAKLGGSFHDNGPGGSSAAAAAAAGHSSEPLSSRPSQRLLKNITLHSKETFYKWRRQQKAGYQHKYYHAAAAAAATPGTLSTSNSSQSGHTSATSYTTSGAGASSYGRLTEQQLLLQQQLQHEQQMGMPHDGTSPQRYAFAQMQLAQQQQLLLQQQLQQQQQSLNGPLLGQQEQQQGQGPPPSKGLLSAVLEGGSESTYESESVHSLPTINSQKTGMGSKASSFHSHHSQLLSHQYPGPGSFQGTAAAAGGAHQQQQQLLPGNNGLMSLRHGNLASTTNTNLSSSITGGGLPQQGIGAEPVLRHATPRGRCLTLPSEPVGNDGLDNVEGNLILFENDVLVVPSRNPTRGPTTNTGSGSGTSDKGLEFHVQSMLGQGTFAQVFCCWESVSKKHVALKIIKNKPAFTKQAAVEIEVFRALAAKTTDPASSGLKKHEHHGGEHHQQHLQEDVVTGVGGSTPTSPHMVSLLSSFMYQNHLCLVFELLGLNLYEVLKKRQFRGLPLPLVRGLVQQGLEGLRELAGKTIVHCDLKPENILLVGEEVEKDIVGAGEGGNKSNFKDISSDCSVMSVTSTTSKKDRLAPIPQTIKLIDFGSACFEGYSAHTYIQSRFYRSPEVLMGLPYDSAIDMWSLGCVAAELFLGLPILPGVHEHDQCGRIIEMIGEIPDWMLEQGSKATKYYLKYMPRTATNNSHGVLNDGIDRTAAESSNSHRPVLPQWRLKTQEEYIKSLTQNEIRKKGGLAKLEKQPANRYFKRTKLSDIIMLHGQHCVEDEKELLGMFVHFLYGLLDPDPWKRWTAYQASQHPFVTGQIGQLRKKGPDTKLDYKEENQANRLFDVYWVPPWDPGICRRKLLSVQRIREKQNDRRRGHSQSRSGHGMEGPDPGNQQSPSMNSVMVADSPSVSHMSVDGSKSSPPSQIASKQLLQRELARGSRAGPPSALASSMSALGNVGMQAQLQMENPVRHEHLMSTPSSSSNLPRFTGPQSYTAIGNYESAPIEADFAYALQRPGNIPGLGRDDGTVVSQASLGQLSMASSHTGVHSAQQRHQHSQQPYGVHGRLSHQDVPGYQLNAANRVNSLPNPAGYPNQSVGMLNAGGVSFQGYGGGGLSSSGHFDQGGVQYLAAQQRLQKEQARSGQQHQIVQQPMDPYHQEMLIQEQQKQLLALQQQHQAQLAALQQQQQIAFQQQQQLLLNQYGQTGNGYYYVTSADGTPMLMQGGGGAPPMGASYGSAAGNAYMMPPQQQQQGSLRDRSTDRRHSGHGQGGSYRR